MQMTVEISLMNGAACQVTLVLFTMGLEDVSRCVLTLQREDTSVTVDQDIEPKRPIPRSVRTLMNAKNSAIIARRYVSILMEHMVATVENQTFWNTMAPVKPRDLLQLSFTLLDLKSGVFEWVRERDDL